MSQISIHIHPDLASALLADGAAGARAIGSLSRQALGVVQAHGRRIAYAPLYLPDGGGCAMSARGGVRGVVVEIDPAGTLIAGRGVVREPAAPVERPGQVRRPQPRRS